MDLHRIPALFTVAGQKSKLPRHGGEGAKAVAGKRLSPYGTAARSSRGSWRAAATGRRQQTPPGPRPAA